MVGIAQKPTGILDRLAAKNNCQSKFTGVPLFWKRKKVEPPSPEEPVFIAVKRDDPETVLAHAMAADTVDVFLEHIQRPGGHICAAKLRFRDPDLSDALGEDRFLFMWLSPVEFSSAGSEFSGTFFHVPKEMLRWHSPGQRLFFERDDIFDWFVNDDGALHGGFTMRVHRSRLPEEERAAFDEYTGVRHWV